MTVKELRKLFNNIKRKHFSGLKTKIEIERTLTQEDTSCVAFYFAPLDCVYIYQWHMKQATKNELKSTIIHELVHAFYKEKFDALCKSPLVQLIESHDSDFMKLCYQTYKNEFKGQFLENCLRQEYFTINNRGYTMKQAMKLYNIRRK